MRKPDGYIDRVELQNKKVGAVEAYQNFVYPEHIGFYILKHDERIVTVEQLQELLDYAEEGYIASVRECIRIIGEQS